MVILASDFECVQIIPGAQNGNIQVGCVECSHQLGRVSTDCTVALPREEFALFSQGHVTLSFTVCIKKMNKQFIYCCPALATTPPPPLREWLCYTDGLTNIGMMNAAFV